MIYNLLFLPGWDYIFDYDEKAIFAEMKQEKARSCTLPGSVHSSHSDSALAKGLSVCFN